MTSTPIPTAVEARRGGGAMLAAVRIGAGQTLAGWPVLVGRCLFYTLLLATLSALWDKVAAERLPGTLAHAVPAGGFALYIGVTEWVTLSLPAAHLRLEDDIRSGGLEPYLLRPKSYLAQVFAQSMGAGLVRLSALGATAIVLLAASGRPWPEPMAFALLPVVGVLGVAVGVLLYMLAGLAAFWARRVLPFQLVIQKLMFLLGGLYAPVTLYPDVMQRVAEASPFAAHLYWPASLVIEPTLSHAAIGAGWQVLWMLVLTGACRLLWRAGLAKVLTRGGV
ncbi:ABC-2 family transporter protein [Phenylobacterium koreense]|uniref:ABC-2 type transport system permease protein n=1 Tax=Phenylobacterium koreense TaxID=266125 RepID=A0ABV2ENH7_9CAUL